MAYSLIQSFSYLLLILLLIYFLIGWFIDEFVYSTIDSFIQYDVCFYLFILLIHSGINQNTQEIQNERFLASTQSDKRTHRRKTRTGETKT